jgi:alpha,alpha-trehalose phosphorylase (configuration-retaining)
MTSRLHSVDPVPIPIPLYIGIALTSNAQRDSTKFGIYIYDGHWSYESYKEDENTPSSIKSAACVKDKIIQFLKTYQRDHKCKIIIAGLVHCENQSLADLKRRLWFDLDILPCIIKATGTSLEETACSAARKASRYISPTGIPSLCRIQVGYRHEVEVDGNGSLTYCTLNDYKPFFTVETWDNLLKTTVAVSKRNKRIVFFNSTPQGGGVSIIRHSSIRLFKLLGIHAHWFVTKPNPEVFEITKKKFHNVLQGVAPSSESAELTESDMRTYERWCESNVNAYWNNMDSPICKADVIVMDDPQCSGIIKLLKKINTTAKVVYRSHIEIRSDLTDCTNTVQHRVWNYLWENIRLCDIFVGHPVDRFIPESVKQSGMKIIQMPAVTDPCDGLNKPLDDFALRYHRLLFNRSAFDQMQNRVDFTRPYYIQIARFDPSKGISDLIHAYLGFRKKINSQSTFESSEHSNSSIPQLIISGHGSIDDPEASTIHSHIIDLLESIAKDDWVRQSVIPDIIIVRLGPSDQILNAILTGAECAFQLSHREGFEIKISESLLKGIPVVAYDSGGIPLQIRDGIDGYLVESGNVKQVAQLMYDLYRDKQHLSKLKHGMFCNREWILTPSNIIRWNQMMLEA